MKYSDYKYRIEAHAHTSPASLCSDIPPMELIDVYKDAGVDAVVITNHFTKSYFCDGDGKENHIKKYLLDFEKAYEYGKKRSVNVILGMEIRFDNENINDYLVYGIDKDFIFKAYDSLDGNIEEFYKNLKTDKNVILQAHPFRNEMERIDESFIDGIETFNMHPNHNSRISFANKYFQKNPDFIATAGSDYHHESHEAVGLILSKTLPKDSFEFAELLKSKDYIFDIGGTIVLPYQIMNK